MKTPATNLQAQPCFMHMHMGMGNEISLTTNYSVGRLCSIFLTLAGCNGDHMPCEPACSVVRYLCDCMPGGGCWLSQQDINKWRQLLQMHRQAPCRTCPICESSAALPAPFLLNTPWHRKSQPHQASTHVQHHHHQDVSQPLPLPLWGCYGLLLAIPPSIPRSQICLGVPWWRHFYWPVVLARSGTRQNPQTPTPEAESSRDAASGWHLPKPGQAPQRSLPGRGSSHFQGHCALQAPSVPEEAACVSQSPVLLRRVPCSSCRFKTAPESYQVLGGV